MSGKFVENSTEPTASESVHSRSSGLKSTISEMRSDLLQQSRYGLWMPSTVGNADWRNATLSRDCPGYWPSLFPVSSVPGVISRSLTTFDCPQKKPNCGTEASATSLSRSLERTASSCGDVAKKTKDPVDFRPRRDQEEFSLWKMATLIHNIAPSDRKGPDVQKDEEFYQGSSTEDGKTAEQSWMTNYGYGRNELQLKSSSAADVLLYPVFGRRSGSSDFDARPNLHVRSEKTAEDQSHDNTAVMRSRGGHPSKSPQMFMLKQSEELSGNGAIVAMNHTQSFTQSSDTTENHLHTKTRDSETSGMFIPRYDAKKGQTSAVDQSCTVNNIDNSQMSTGSGGPLHHEDISGRCVRALPVESASSGAVGLTPDKLPVVSSVSASESTNNGGSLYRRRVKNLLLKHESSLTDGVEAAMPKSPRIPNHFRPAFEHDDTAQDVSATDNGCGNFHEEKCGCERKNDGHSGTDVACCHSLKDLENESGRVVCHSGSSSKEEQASKSEKMPGLSCGVVNYATVSSEVSCQDYRACVSGIGCCLYSNDGMKPGCVEKGLHVNSRGLCCHGGCGTMSHSACQYYYTDISACRMSPSCHVPVKASPTGVCDAAAASCCVAHRLGAVPTPTRACAAALCQLSCSGVSSHAGSPKSTETATGCALGCPKLGNQCATPFHPGLMKYACGAGEGHPAPVHPTGCPHSMKRSSSRGCLGRVLHQDHSQQPVDTHAHTPCMAHTPYTPRETYTPREPDTAQESNEPCTPQSVCSHRARKLPRTPSAACFFQFPPQRAVQLDCAGGSTLCQSPCVSYARRLPACRTPCMSPLNLTVGQTCVAHSCTPQCIFQQHKLTACAADHHRPACVRISFVI